MTNSTILNTGLWIQIVFSMTVTIVLVLLMASKRQQKWDFVLRMSQIDETLQNKFHIKLHYELYSRYVYSVIMYTVKFLRTNFFYRYLLVSIVLCMILISVYYINTCYYMWYLRLSTSHMVCICGTILLTNLCNFAIFYQFISALMYISTRFNMINHLLEQMLIDVPIIDRFYMDFSNVTGKQSILISVQSVSNIQTLNRVLDGIHERTGNIVSMRSSTERATRFGYRQFHELMTMT